MAIEAGPSIAVASTPASIGGEISTGIPALNSFSSLSSFPEFSTKITPDSPGASIQGFYPLDGLANPGGVKEGPVSPLDISSYRTIIAQAPEVNLTEKSGLETSPFPSDPLIYNPRTSGVEDLGLNIRKPDAPGLADIDLSDSAAKVEVPRGIARSLENIYSELSDQVDRETESMMLPGTENAEMTIQVEEVMDNVEELNLPDDQAAEFAVDAAVPRLEILPQAVVEVATGEPLIKSPDQIQLEHTIEALIAAHISVAGVEKMLQSVAQEKGLRIVIGEKSEEDIPAEELAEPEVEELQEVLTGLKTVTTSRAETSAQNRYRERVLSRIQKIVHLRRDDRAAKNRREALKVATEQAFKLRDQDSSNKSGEVSGVEIVAQVNAPEDKVNSAVHPGGPEEGWALTLAEFARRKFENPEQALEFAEELVLRKIQPVEEADEPNPPVSLEEYKLAVSKRISSQSVVDSLRNQVSTLPKAA